MRRLPIYFLVDVSESMVGEPIEQVQKGMRTIIQELRVDPYALETAFVSVIAFAGKAKSLSLLTELYKFYPPVFPIGGGTSLGAALEYLMDDMDRSLQKTTVDMKGDWKPIVFLFTDGTPTDDTAKAFARWNAKYRKSCNLVAISIGDNVDTHILGQISDNVLLLKETDAESFTKFFKWVTASIKATSVSVSDYSNDDVQLAPTNGINLEKVDTTIHCKVDENFAVLLGKCQTTNKSYLIKYRRRFVNFEDISNLLNGGFGLIGAYPIDEKDYGELSLSGASAPYINTSILRGVPTCPCCGNQLGLVICECGNLFCAGDNSNTHCPWCGTEGVLSAIEGDGMNVTRTRG
ncbi:MAG: TerY-C metal binding domain-containing protein [Bacteroidia bacterium]|nr:TerY-C metal binding domain-containing protein [Bacteroidia bacterium]